MNFKFFTGHESFYPREGWLKKGVDAVKEDSSIFQKKKLIKAINTLGIGSNMVKSLKYWLEYFNFLNKNNKLQEYYLSDEAKIIQEYDPFFQSVNTIWLLHFFSCKNSAIWQIMFQDEVLPEFDANLLQEIVRIKLIEKNQSFAENTIKYACQVFIKTYLWEKIDYNPEDNLISILSKLRLLKKVSKNKYSFRKIDYSDIDPLLINFLLFYNFEKKASHVTLEEAYSIITKYIRIDIHNLRKILHELETRKIITIDRAARLNNIVLTEERTKKRIIEKLLHWGKYEK